MVVESLEYCGCGGRPEVAMVAGKGSMRFPYIVRCGCGAVTDSHENRADAVQEWNVMVRRKMF